jgi:hypothetical protein
MQQGVPPLTAPWTLTQNIGLGRSQVRTIAYLKHLCGCVIPCVGNVTEEKSLVFCRMLKIESGVIEVIIAESPFWRVCTSSVPPDYEEVLF